MKAKITIGLALICALAGSRAQVSPLDSLYDVARAEKNDTLRFLHYHKIANQYYQDAKFEELQDFLREKSAEIREYLKQDLNSAERSTGLRLMALYHHTRASAYYRSSKMEQAWEQLDSSRVICLNLEAQRHLLKVYNLAGAICQFQSLNDSALYYCTYKTQGLTARTWKTPQIIHDRPISRSDQATNSVGAPIIFLAIGSLRDKLVHMPLISSILPWI